MCETVCLPSTALCPEMSFLSTPDNTLVSLTRFCEFLIRDLLSDVTYDLQKCYGLHRKNTR